jgi:hypothetical protein
MAGFPNLPGVQVTLNDLGLAIAPPPAGPKVTLLGVTSNTDIPLREQLTVSNIGQATSSLWAGQSGLDDRYPSELSIAIEEAARVGAENIEIVVINWRTGDDYTNYISPVGNGQNQRHADLVEAYNAIRNLDLDVVVPVGAWADATGVNFGSQLANFCHQATTESDNACNGVISLMPIGQWANAHHDSYASSEGTGNTTEVEMATYTGQASYLFQLPSRALVDEWAKYATQNDSPVITSTLVPTWFDNYLAGSEAEDGTFYPLNDENGAVDVNSDYWTNWQAVNIDGSLAIDQRSNQVDAGSRISVVGCPLHTQTTQLKALAKGVGAVLSKTVQATDGAAAYGGFMTTLAPQSSPTNKRISTLAPQRPLSAVQANRLAGRRIVTFHERANGFVVSNAMTGAYNASKYVRSDYVRLTTVRVVDAVVDLIRSTAEKYIGEPNTAAQRNALSNEIDKFLKGMRVVNAINGYKFEITATPEQQVLGEATIDLTIVPPFEIIKIQTNISLAKAV